MHLKKLFKLVIVIIVSLTSMPLFSQLEQGGGTIGGGCSNLSPATVSELDVAGHAGSVIDLKGGTNNGWNNQIRFWNACESAGDGQVLQHIIATNKSSGRLIIVPGNYSQASDVMEVHGKIAIGTSNAVDELTGPIPLNNYRLYVNGGILAEEVRVATGWGDYVFFDDYNLKPLKEVKTFIDENGHLPEVPSAEEVEEEGLNLGDMMVTQQVKIEELFLYLIQLEERIDTLEEENKELQDELEQVVKANKKDD